MSLLWSLAKETHKCASFLSSGPNKNSFILKEVELKAPNVFSLFINWCSCYVCLICYVWVEAKFPFARITVCVLWLQLRQHNLPIPILICTHTKKSHCPYHWLFSLALAKTTHIAHPFANLHKIKTKTLNSNFSGLAMTTAHFTVNIVNTIAVATPILWPQVDIKFE